jgi:hypothetical protein
MMRAAGGSVRDMVGDGESKESILTIPEPAGVIPKRQREWRGNAYPS